MDDNIQPVTVGDSVALAFGADPQALTVRITQRSVEAARETPLQKFIYTPRIWASSVVSLVVVVLLGSAFASGTIRPTPPPLPTLAPGEPTPTPDTRPRISLPFVQLVGPPAAPTATPGPASSGNGAVQAPAGIATLTLFNPTPEDEPTLVPQDVAPSQSATCNQLIRFGCPSAPQPPPAPRQAPAPQPQPQPATSLSIAPTEAAPQDPAFQAIPPEQATQPATPPQQPGEQTPPCANLFGLGCAAAPLAPAAPATRVLPVPSPGPSGDSRDVALRPSGPKPGSNLDMALRVANIASEQFNRSLEDGPTAGSVVDASTDSPTDQNGQ